MNKKKIVNDPVYGFITIPDELIFDLVSAFTTHTTTGPL
jgi:HD superfamily phosphohydrolase